MKIIMLRSIKPWLFQNRFNEDDYERMITVEVNIGVKFSRKAFDIADKLQFKVGYNLTSSGSKLFLI